MCCTMRCGMPGLLTRHEILNFFFFFLSKVLLNISIEEHGLKPVLKSVFLNFGLLSCYNTVHFFAVASISYHYCIPTPKGHSLSARVLSFI